ncbi:hypothetical protein TWF281_006326 [Arthrobotrys megalospora]
MDQAIEFDQPREGNEQEGKKTNVIFRHVIDYEICKEVRIAVGEKWRPTEPIIKNQFLLEFDSNIHICYITSNMNTRSWLPLSPELMDFEKYRSKTIYLEVRKRTDKSPNASPANTMNKAAGSKAKGYLRRLSIEDASNSLDHIIFIGREEVENEGQDPVSLIFDDETLWFSESTIISHFEKLLELGGNLFNLWLEVSEKEGRLIVDEAVWRDQLLRQADGRARRLKSWFNSKLGDHQTYIQSLKSLPDRTAEAMQQYIVSLGNFGKDGYEDLTRNLNENFDDRYGIRPGPFFELDDVDHLHEVKVPSGMGLLRHLRHGESGTSSKVLGTCVGHYLLPQLRNLFNPEIREANDPKSTSPLYMEKLYGAAVPHSFQPLAHSDSGQVEQDCPPQRLPTPIPIPRADIPTLEHGLSEPSLQNKRMLESEENDGEEGREGGGNPDAAGTASPDSKKATKRQKVATDSGGGNLVKPVRRGFNAFNAMGKGRKKKGL